MSTELIINASLPETRIALMENGEIQDLLIERASGKGIVGNIYKGRVTRVLPGMQAAFVDIGLEKAAFLYVDDVYTSSEIWEEEEGPSEESKVDAFVDVNGAQAPVVVASETVITEVQEVVTQAPEESSDLDAEDSEVPGDPEEEQDDDEEGDEGPEEMGPEGSGGGDDEQPAGTVAPPEAPAAQESQSEAGSQGGEEGAVGNEGGAAGDRARRHRRGRRGGRNRNRRGPGVLPQGTSTIPTLNSPKVPEEFHEQVSDEGEGLDSDRSAMSEESAGDAADTNRPAIEGGDESRRDRAAAAGSTTGNRDNFREPRSRDRRVRARSSMRPPRAQVNIQDLLKEGQEVIVQVAKDPIATKGARLTCHLSLPGRHLVCMPTIDHVGVSRRIERDDERRKLRDFVERNRPRNLGFIVRTASGRQQSEKRLKQDIDYLVRIWDEIRQKAGEVQAPALVYEDLNSVLRAIRDWVTEDIDKIIVDSRYHYNDIQRFASHFMPGLRQKIELYHGDIPIFDAYNITTELSRSLERKVWLKSGGYLVIDQAEALVAIDVNTGRYVGKKNLEDTILKTNLEAVQEIAYQLRLRNCGGIIILDLIDMEKEENKQRVYRALEEALKHDRARPTILKISELGLVEMTRKRTRDTLVRALCESCSHCEGKGFVKSKLTVAYEILREIEREGIERDVNKIMVQANPDVIDALAIEERETLDQLERRYRKQIYLQAVGDFHAEQFEITSDKKEKGEQGWVPQAEQDRSRAGNRNRGSNNHRDRDRNGGNGRGRGGPRRDAEVQASGPQEGGAPSLPKPNLDVIINPVSTSVDPDAQPAYLDQPMASGPVDDGFDNEEDRLAFLRAQAAQDAAIAQLRSAGQPDVGRRNAGGGGHSGGRTHNNNGGGGGDRGGSGPGARRGRRGRRNNMSGGGGGGKFRGRDDFRGNRPSGAPGIPSINPVVAESAPSQASDSDSSGGGGGGESSGGGNGHSQPPVT